MGEDYFREAAIGSLGLLHCVDQQSATFVAAAAERAKQAAVEKAHVTYYQQT